MITLLLTVALAAEIPDLIPSAHHDAPAWVSVELAVSETGMLREEMVGYSATRLRDLARKNTVAAARKGGDVDACHLSTGTVACDFKPKGSLEALTRSAEAIVAGEVVAAREGFAHGQPGTLLLLNARSLKGTPAPTTYLFYPFARIRTSEGMICTFPLRDRVAPQVGDRLLLFAMYAPRVENDRAVIHIDVDRQLVHERRDGSVSLPKALQSFADARIESIEGAVVAEIERQR